MVSTDHEQASCQIAYVGEGEGPRGINANAPKCTCVSWCYDHTTSKNIAIVLIVTDIVSAVNFSGDDYELSEVRINEDAVVPSQVEYTSFLNYMGVSNCTHTHAFIDACMRQTTPLFVALGAACSHDSSSNSGCGTPNKAISQA